MFLAACNPKIKHSGFASKRTEKIDLNRGFCWFLMFTSLTQLSVDTLTGLLKLFSLIRGSCDFQSHRSPAIDYLQCGT